MTLIDTVGSTLGGTQEEIDICCNNKKEDCNKHSNSVTQVKSLKGIYLRSLQHRDDMIVKLIEQIMTMNYRLIEINTSKCNCDKQDIEMESKIKETILKDMLTQRNIDQLLQYVQIPKSSSTTEQERFKQLDNKCNCNCKCCCRCRNNNDMSSQPLIQPILGRNNEGVFPPSSVEQALKKGFERIVPTDIAETKMGKQLTTTMIQGLLKNPELIPKLMEMGINAEKNNVTKDLLLSKPEQFKKASQEIVNKSLTTEDETQLEELAARIDKQEKELKEQEIQNFLQSSVETDI